MFFDGSYLYEEKDKNGHKILRHGSFFQDIPRWRYVYNTVLAVLDALMMLLSCTIVLFIRPDIAQTITRLPGGTIATVATFCVVWLISLLVMRSYRRHMMGEGYIFYAKVLTAAVVNFIALCSCAYIDQIVPNGTYARSANTRFQCNSAASSPQ